MYTKIVKFSVDCEALIDARGEMTDYGVPGSPRWVEYEPTGWGDLTIDIAGIDVKLSELPKGLRDALWDCAYENMEEGNWE